MAVTRHDAELIQAYAILGTIPQTPRGFTRLGIISGDSNLDGDNARRYTTAEDAQDDNTAGFLSAQALAEVLSIFAQVRTAGEVWVIKYDVVGGVASVALDTIKAESVPVVVLTLTSRADADIVELSTANQALIASKSEKGFVFLAQSSDATLKTGALPAGLAALADHKFTCLYYHNDNTQPLTTGHGSYRVSFDPDVVSAAWNGAVRGVEPLSALTPTEYANLTALHVNFPAGFGTELWVSPGVSLEGRPIENLITALWMEARINEAAINTVIQASERGEKIPVRVEGQIIFEAQAIRPVYDLAGDLGHIVPLGSDPETRIDRPPITDADKAAFRVPMAGSVKPTAGARAFDMPLYFTFI